MARSLRHQCLSRVQGEGVAVVPAARMQAGTGPEHLPPSLMGMSPPHTQPPVTHLTMQPPEV